jgi:CheY-like chemotaxis protein
MNSELKRIMLVDDDSNDNYFHEREIRKVKPDTIFIEMTTGLDALEYLKSNKDKRDMLPDLLFLDINMPAMDGWEFLEAYNKLDIELQSGVIIIMLSTSGNPEDIVKAMTFSCVSDYLTKPLTREIMESIILRFFKE